jgi:hypothetical protein
MEMRNISGGLCLEHELPDCLRTLGSDRVGRVEVRLGHGRVRSCAPDMMESGWDLWLDSLRIGLRTMPSWALTPAEMDYRIPASAN